MSHSKSKLPPNASKYLTSILLSVLAFILHFYFFAYVLFMLPKLYFLYNFFPFFLLALESLTIAFLCRKLFPQPVMPTFVSSLFVSVLSIVLGGLLFKAIPLSLVALFSHALFVVCTVVLQMLRKEKRAKKIIKKKMPFEK